MKSAHYPLDKKGELDKQGRTLLLSEVCVRISYLPSKTVSAANLFFGRRSRRARSPSTRSSLFPLMAFIFDGQMCDAAEMDPVLGTGVGMTYGPHEELARPTRPVVMASRVPDARVPDGYLNESENSASSHALGVSDAQCEASHQLMAALTAQHAASKSAPMRQQDCVLPVANVARVMSQALPPGIKITRDSKHLMQELVSEFIGFVTSEANDKCLAEHKRTIYCRDVLDSLCNVGECNDSAIRTKKCTCTCTCSCTCTAGCGRGSGFKYGIRR